MVNNAIQYCFNYVKRFIPRYILDIGFNNDTIFNTSAITLDDKIYKTVYLNMLKPDLDITNSLPCKINVQECDIIQLNTPKTYIITVPKKLTDYRSIVAVRQLVSYANFNALGMTNPIDKSSLVTYARKAMQAVDTITLISTSRLELVGDNKIYVQDPTVFPISAGLECDIEHGPNLETIHPKFYKMVAELMLHAVKIYIRTNTILDLNEGHIRAGHEISIIKDEIEKYEEAKERYDELLTDWRSLGIFNSNKAKTNLIRTLVSNRA